MIDRAKEEGAQAEREKIISEMELIVADINDAISNGDIPEDTTFEIGQRTILEKLIKKLKEQGVIL